MNRRKVAQLPLPAGAMKRALHLPSRFARVILLVAVPLLTISVKGVTPSSAAPTMEAVQRRAFNFFWRESHPATGLTKDREKNRDGADADQATVASIASTGYMLAALPIGVEHGWISRQDAYARALTTLRFVFEELPQVHGFYYHFVDWKTGERVWDCELSSIDTALLMLGALAAGEYWSGTPLRPLAESVAKRVDWRWMQSDNGARPAELAPSMGWFPDKGFIATRWKGYNEALLLYLLGLGTPGENGMTPAAWDAWTFPTVSHEGYEVFGGPAPIFFAQMAPGYFDLRGLRDRQGRDWWRTWRNAHLADQAYCARHPANKTYAGAFWGINASDQPDGYGAEWPADGHNRGTVSPTAMLAGVVFTPNRARKAMADLWKLRDKIWGRYGFSNAFNIELNWYGKDVIGIDLGMMLLQIENARSGLIWRLMGRSPFTKRGLAAAGFHRAPSPDNIDSDSRDSRR